MNQNIYAIIHDWGMQVCYVSIPYFLSLVNVHWLLSTIVMLYCRPQGNKSLMLLSDRSEKNVCLKKTTSSFLLIDCNFFYRKVLLSIIFFKKSIFFHRHMSLWRIRMTRHQNSARTFMHRRWKKTYWLGQLWLVSMLRIQIWVVLSSWL